MTRHVSRPVNIPHLAYIINSTANLGIYHAKICMLTCVESYACEIIIELYRTHVK